MKLKLISWNVNGLRAVHKKYILQDPLWKEYEAICFQETKINPEALTPALKEWNGYQSYWACAQKRGYSGVVTYTKEPALKVELMGEKAFDEEGRFLLLELQHLVLINCYFPNAQEKGRRLDYKLQFCWALEKKLQALNTSKPILICGDYNIAYRPIDLSLPEQNEQSPGYLPQERAWMEEFLSKGFKDTFRLFHQEAQYSWWSYRTRARDRNIGWRIDYFCVDASSQRSVKQANILGEIYGSDHCPVDILMEV